MMIWISTRWGGLVALAVAGAALLLFNRVEVLSGFQAVLGDAGDGRFNLAVLEHWYRVTLGAEAAASPGYYFPVPGVLGYSDGLVLLAPVYVAGRWAGLGVVPALAGTVMVASAVGFAGMVVFLRRLLGLAWPAVLAGAGAFATGTALYQSLSVGHVQMMVVEALPWLVCLVWRYARSGGGGVAAGAALLLAAILLSSFYVGWFLAIYLLVLAALGLIMALSLAGFTRTVAAARLWLVGRRRSLPAMVLVLGLGLVPFLMIYGPVAHDHSEGRPWSEVVRTLPDASQLLEARGNALWSPVIEALWPGLSTRGGELGKGLSWALLLVFVITLVRLARGPVAGLAPETRRLALVLGAGVLVCWALMLQSHGWSLWTLVYQGVPGGRSVRSVFRFNLVLSFSVAAVAAIGLHCAWLWAGRATAAQSARVAVGLAAMVLIVEQVNVLSGTLSRSGDFADVEAMPPVPKACRALVLLPSAPPPAYHRWSHQLGAVMVAQAWGVPVLNGYSGLAPDGWRLFDPTDRDGYRQAVVTWVDRYGLWQGLCGMDLELHRWFPVMRAGLLP